MRGSFGELLGKSRQAKKITLRKLSQLVGLSPSFLSEMETGRRLPPKDKEKIRDLALILNQDEEQFLEAAQKERVKSDPRLLEKLFSADGGDLAWGLYRAVENATDDEIGELQEAFKNALNTLKRKGESVE